MKRKIVPDVVSGDQAIGTIGRSATVREAAERLAKRKVAALLVTDDEALAGIITERDLVYRIVAERMDPDGTTVGEIMTANPKTIGPGDTAARALDMMRDGHFRHLPVVDGGNIVGIVSIRDLYEAMAASLEEDLESAQTLIYGDQYGGVTA